MTYSKRIYHNLSKGFSKVWKGEGDEWMSGGIQGSLTTGSYPLYFFAIILSIFSLRSNSPTPFLPSQLFRSPLPDWHISGCKKILCRIWKLNCCRLLLHMLQLLFCMLNNSILPFAYPTPHSLYSHPLSPASWTPSDPSPAQSNLPQDSVPEHNNGIIRNILEWMKTIENMDLVSQRNLLTAYILLTTRPHWVTKLPFLVYLLLFLIPPLNASVLVLVDGVLKR